MSTARAISAAELAVKLGATVIGPGDVTFTHLQAIDRTGPGGLTFIRSGKYAAMWGASRAAGAIVAKEVPLAHLVPQPESPVSERPLLIVADADMALITAIEYFAPEAPAPVAGRHPSAVIDASAQVDAGATIGPGCVVQAGARVGSGAVLIGDVYVGRGASVGAGTVLHPGVRVLDRCVVGAACILHAGVSIGADGFGYRPGPKGPIKIPHIGNVEIHDGVEIGANSCVDRAKFGSTVIGAATKIDNLVQIGHGCRIGRGCIICGLTGLAGSVVLGDGVTIGGQAGVADNVEIGAGAKIAAGSGVNNHVPPGAVYMGMPAGPVGEWRRTYATLRRMGKRSSSEM